jgi:hypothetical protein
MFTGPALSNQQAESVHLRGQANGRQCLANASSSGVMTAMRVLQDRGQSHEIQEFSHFPSENDLSRLHFGGAYLPPLALPLAENSIPDGASFHLSFARPVHAGSRHVDDGDSDVEDVTHLRQPVPGTVAVIRAKPIAVALSPGHSIFDPIYLDIVVREPATHGPNGTVFVNEHSIDGHAIIQSTDPETPTMHILKFHVMCEGLDLWYFESSITKSSKDSYYDFIGCSRRKLFHDFGVAVCAPLPSCTRCQRVYNDLCVGRFIIAHCECRYHHQICGSCHNRRSWPKYKCPDCDVHPVQSVSHAYRRLISFIS